jgi:hypothetical protein
MLLAEVTCPDVGVLALIDISQQDKAGERMNAIRQKIVNADNATFYIAKCRSRTANVFNWRLTAKCLARKV